RLWARRGALRRDHHQGRTGGAGKLPRLSDAASRRDAAGGDSDRRERRFLGGGRGNRCGSPPPRPVPRGFLGDRQAPPLACALKPRFEKRITKTNGRNRRPRAFGRPDMNATRVVTAIALVFTLIGHASAAGPADAPPGALSCSGCHPAARTAQTTVPRLTGRNPAD